MNIIGIAGLLVLFIVALWLENYMNRLKNHISPNPYKNKLAMKKQISPAHIKNQFEFFLDNELEKLKRKMNFHKNC